MYTLLGFLFIMGIVLLIYSSKLTDEKIKRIGLIIGSLIALTTLLKGTWDLAKGFNPSTTEVGENNYAQSDEEVGSKESEERKRDTIVVEKNTVTSYNQSGGVTANEYHHHEGTPDPPVEQEIIRILNTINPKIIDQYRHGKTAMCVMISPSNQTELNRIKSKLEEKKLLKFLPNGNTNMASMGCSFNSSLGICINDVDELNTNGYNLHFLENFESLLK